jgi:rRNA-processing protein FCF1
MNVLTSLCLPFLEALATNDAFDLSIPCVGNELSRILENEDEEQRTEVAQKLVVKRYTNVHECKKYAQVMAIAALVAELQNGK